MQSVVVKPATLLESCVLFILFILYIYNFILLFFFYSVNVAHCKDFNIYRYYLVFTILLFHIKSEWGKNTKINHSKREQLRVVKRM